MGKGSPFDTKKYADSTGVACPKCKRRAGLPCAKWVVNRGIGEWNDSSRRVHPERRRAADDKRTREVREAGR